jgi:hypothetical protein
VPRCCWSQAERCVGAERLRLGFLLILASLPPLLSSSSLLSQS